MSQESCSGNIDFNIHTLLITLTIEFKERKHDCFRKSGLAGALPAKADGEVCGIVSCDVFILNLFQFDTSTYLIYVINALNLVPARCLSCNTRRPSYDREFIPGIVPYQA